MVSASSGSSKRTRLRTLRSIAVFALLTACSGDGAKSTARDAGADATVQPEASTGDAAPSSGVTPAPDGKPYATLAEWHLFTDAKKQKPSQRVVPYDVIAPLYSDYATKYRFIYLPEGEHIGYTATGAWKFPVGTVLVKTFSYLTDPNDPSKGERLLETRLLIHQADGWTPRTYVWDAEQTGATLERGGEIIQTEFVDPTGKKRTNGYAIPSEGDCRSCHGKLGATDTLGGRTLQLDRDHDYGNGPENQIDHLAKLGFFDTAPEPASERVHLVDPFGSAPLVERVRSYFEGNCFHCHQPGSSPGSLSGLWLDYASTDPVTGQRARWGYCKQPASAGGGTCGNQFDVVPGKPDASVMTCRMESLVPKEKMPPIGRNVVHAEGVALIRQWIESVPGACGTPTPQPDAGTPDAATPSDASTADASTTDAATADAN